MELLQKNPQDIVYGSAESRKRMWSSFKRTISRVAFKEEAQILGDFASIRPGDKVLEVGCGTGRVLEGLSLVTPQILGVDMLWEAVTETRANHVPVVQANGFHLPFKDNTFDCVICNDVIHGIPSSFSEVFLRELNRVARDRVVIGMVRNRLALFCDPGLVFFGLRRRRLAEAASINTKLYWFWRFKRVARSVGAEIFKVQPSARFLVLFNRYPWYKRMYRVRPGRIGIVGWLLPKPYNLLQYDVLLVKSIEI